VNLLEEKLEIVVAIKNILFATDFSEISEAALPYVTALSLRYGSTVHVAHVLPEATFVRPSPVDPVLFGSIYEQAHSGAQEKIQRLSDRLRGFPHKTHIRHGKVSDVLSGIIREQAIDLLVVGTHGRTGLGKLIMGSAAEEIFRLAPCPVLTVGPRVAGLEQVMEARRHHDLPPVQVKFRRILYATDFQPESAKTVSYATSLAREFDARLTLLHVIEDYGDRLHQRPGPIDSALRKLEELVPDDAGLRYRPEVVAEFGVPAELILQTAAEYDADLIVLGVRSAAGHLGAATHLGGSTAHKVVASANSPVLTVRSGVNF
jgi:nucleotide-binding universal stress UspA family protein